MTSIIKTYAAVLLGAAVLATPALADKVLSGSEAQTRLQGRSFDFICMDGTQGRANYQRSGYATASYRLANAGGESAVAQTDRGQVRAEGDAVCIRWQTLNSGREGCFTMTERSPGNYRIATQITGRWCDLSERRGS